MQRLLLICILFTSLQSSAQTDSSISSKKKIAGCIVPAAMVTYGVVALKNPELIHINQTMQQKIWVNNPHKTTSIDDYLVFVPAAAVYGLNAINIKSKHNFVDRSFLYGMSMVLATGVVTSVKHISKEMRPDFSNQLSFPSGHAADAFVAAEFLWQEYKDVSPWYGVAGYAVAATTGYLRMYNNKHWLSDVIAGAGVGILSTKAAYYIYPRIKKKFQTRNLKNNIVLLPFYQQYTVGISFAYQF